MQVGCQSRWFNKAFVYLKIKFSKTRFWVDAPRLVCKTDTAKIDDIGKANPPLINADHTDSKNSCGFISAISVHQR
jgi:hypothetical protein